MHTYIYTHKFVGKMDIEKGILPEQRTCHNDKKVNLSGRPKKHFFSPQICVYLMAELQTKLKQELTEVKGETETSTVTRNLHITSGHNLSSPVSVTEFQFVL